tara:strand:+ start:648 stop:857 length:210 start_codon:yes stop_codon:yes gene_type:complete
LSVIKSHELLQQQKQLVVLLVLLVEKQSTPLHHLEFSTIQQHSPLTSLWLAAVAVAVVIMEVVVLAERL